MTMVATRPREAVLALPSAAPRTHRLYDESKRALDLLGALVLIALTSPFLLVAMVVIKLDSPGPLLYVHRRVGQGGRMFTCFKLRTMERAAASKREELRALNRIGGPAFKAPDDPRITRVGRVLRRLSIDELPQLWNVVLGDMSLVGPRPLTQEDYELRDQYVESEELALLVEGRKRVRPGLTGLWQVSGRSTLTFDRWMQLDEEYIQRRSLLFDLVLLLRTIPAVLTMRGAM